ncbi:hypothetical protein MKX01_036102 [Papaver californicum]|nr:hypothetical protein MKX01_036102 [Papaver californicum]
MKHRGLWRSGAIYAVLVDIYGQYGRFQNAEECVLALKSEGVQLSANMFCALAKWLHSTGIMRTTVKVLQLMETEGIEPNLIMLNLLINAFGIAGRHLEALSVFHHIKETVSFLPWLLQSVLFSKLLIMLISPILMMIWLLFLKGISPDVVTYSTLMKAFIRARKFDQVLGIYEEMQSAGCTPDRKARELLQTASGVLEKRHGRGSKS